LLIQLSAHCLSVWSEEQEAVASPEGVVVAQFCAKENAGNKRNRREKINLNIK
jgi:hypothetical protein